MIGFRREVRDDEAIYDIYLKKIIYRSDSPFMSPPQDYRHHQHQKIHDKKLKLPHRDIIKKFFKISRFDNNNDHHHNHNNNDHHHNHNNRIEDKDLINVPFVTFKSNVSHICTIHPHHVANQTEVGQMSQEVEGHLRWTTKDVRVVKYCTLKGLTRSLTAHDTGDMEPSTVHVFLATFRSFSQVGEVLKCLIARYTEVKQDLKLNNPLRENILKNLKLIFLMWILLYPSDFIESANQNPCSLSPSANRKNGSILDKPTKYQQTNENKPLKSFKEFLDANLDPDENVDQQLLKVFKSLVTKNRLLNTEIPILKLSCQRTFLNEDDDDDDDDDDNSQTHHHHHHHSNHCPNLKASELIDFTATCVAEVLTRMDADLFLNVKLHQCLGSTWAKRNKLELSSSSSSRPSTVQATVMQFNAVVYRVMTFVLDKSFTTQERAKVIEGWISVAQECRRMKNFSSLKAILSALQSSSIYRLTHTWRLVKGIHMSTFQSLSLLMSDGDNHKLCRDILEKEGTGKSQSSEVSQNKREQIPMTRVHKGHEDLSTPNQHLLSRKNLGTPDVPNDNRYEGTVPFLGTFLTDLTMIDTAYKDFVDYNEIDDKRSGDIDHHNDRSGGNKKFINFVKKQKEWEVLVRMEILQKAASLYRIYSNMEIYSWLDAIPVYRESDYYKMSLRIQAKVIPKSLSTLSSTSSSTTKSPATPRSEVTLLSLSSMISLDSLSSSSSSPSLPSSLPLSPSPFCKQSRLSTVDDSGVVLLKFNNHRKLPF